MPPRRAWSKPRAKITSSSDFFSSAHRASANFSTKVSPSSASATIFTTYSRKPVHTSGTSKKSPKKKAKPGRAAPPPFSNSNFSSTGTGSDTNTRHPERAKGHEGSQLQPLSQHSDGVFAARQTAALTSRKPVLEDGLQRTYLSVTLEKTSTNHFLNGRRGSSAQSLAVSAQKIRGSPANCKRAE